ncbi:MAG: hypothetical protein AAB583_02880 [Patescibacteria group bacterium]
MKNQKVIIGVFAGILLIVGGGVFLSSSGSKAPVQVTEQAPAENEISAIDPEEIGLDLIPTNNNKHVVIKVDKPQGIKTIEFDLTWGAKVEDKASGELLDVRQGTSSGEDPILLDGKPYSHEVKFGTCSDVCHYDKGVNNIKIILKIVRTDGKLYQSEKTLEL